MTDAAKKILEQFDALPEEDERWLADAIVHRMHGEGDELELSDEWTEEIARRVEQLRSGQVSSVPDAEVEARIRRSLERARRRRGDE